MNTKPKEPMLPPVRVSNDLLDRVKKIAREQTPPSSIGALIRWIVSEWVKKQEK